MIHIIASDHHISSSDPHIIVFFQSPRLTLGDMYTNQVPENYKNGPERGRGGSVLAQTLSKRRPEPQDHVFQALVGPDTKFKN